jgi:hypothetical protein
VVGSEHDPTARPRPLRPHGGARVPRRHRRPADPDTAGDLEDGQAICRQENDPCPLHVLERAAPIADDGGQSRAVIGSYDHADILCHDPKIACQDASVNPVFVSVH